MEAMIDGGQALEWVLSKLGAGKTAPPKFSSTVKPPKPVTDLKSTQAKELELWKTWKKSNEDPKHLDPLLKSFAPKIYERVNKFKNRVEIPTSTIEHEHKKAFVDALRTYDPDRGASLGTHVTNRLMKAGRFVETNKNFSRISENVSKHIGYFNSVKSTLAEQLGHEPDDYTIHDHLLQNPHPKLGSPSIAMIGRLNREQRKGFIQTGHDVEEISGSPNLSSREEEVIHLVYHQLTPQERLVHEYTFGLNGKPALKPGAIAKKLGMDGPKVSKLKSSIREKILLHLE